MFKKNSYKVKYKLAKAHEDMLIDDIARLQAEITELRWQNESLRIENRRLNTIKDRVFEAGCIIAKDLIDLKGTQRG